MTTDPKAVEEAVADIRQYYDQCKADELDLLVVLLDSLTVVITALEERTEALTWIAPFADMRSNDDSKTFSRVNRGALRTISERASSALGDRNEDR